jgi:hypothetical protein
MKSNLIEIQNFLKNKRMCLLGNSKSILKNQKDIDSYDSICRINKGISKEKEHFIGSRTDILFLSTKIEESDIEKNFNPKYVIWVIKDAKKESPWSGLNVIKTPSEDWYEIKNKLTTLPSTGCNAIYFLIKYIDFSQLDIYGFDFFKSGTWYHNLKKQSWHNGNLEEQFINNLIKNSQKVQLIRE